MPLKLDVVRRSLWIIVTVTLYDERMAQVGEQRAADRFSPEILTNMQFVQVMSTINQLISQAVPRRFPCMIHFHSRRRCRHRRLLLSLSAILRASHLVLLSHESMEFRTLYFHACAICITVLA